MFVLDRLLVGSVRFILDKVARAVDEELNDEGRLREALLQATMELEAGEISEEEFATIERDILARLRELRDEGTGGAISFGEGEAEVGIDFDAGDEPDGDAEVHGEQ